MLVYPAVILAIDQGTTGTTCLVVDEALRARRARVPGDLAALPAARGGSSTIPRRSGRRVRGRARRRSRDAGIARRDLAAIGITNQRETTVVWDRATGRAGASRDRLAGPAHGRALRAARRAEARSAERTGLVLDPYFSATKLEWLLAAARDARARGELAFGTIDAWLIWKLTGGARARDRRDERVADDAARPRRRATGTTSCSQLFGVAARVLPEVVPSAGVVAEATLLGAHVPVAGIAGDQQAALFGQACFAPGEAKATYGTGDVRARRHRRASRRLRGTGC